MNELTQQNAPFPRLVGATGNRPWMAMAHAFVTFATLMGAFGVVASLVS